MQGPKGGGGTEGRDGEEEEVGQRKGVSRQSTHQLPDAQRLRTKKATKQNSPAYQHTKTTRGPTQELNFMICARDALKTQNSTKRPNENGMNETLKRVLNLKRLFCKNVNCL